MRCKNPDCDCLHGRVMRSPSDKTRETGFCGICRRKIEKALENKPKKIVQRIRHKPTKEQQFQTELKINKNYRELVEMFDTIVIGNKVNVKSV